LRYAVRAGVAGNLLLACSVSASRAGSTSAPAAELWYAGAAVCGFTHEQLQASASTNPDILVSTSLLTAISDVALDANGNVWIVGSGSDQVFRLPAAALKSPRSVQPDLVVRSEALKNPGNLAFDAGGALWVANRGSVGTSTTGDGSIVGFDIPGGLSGMQDLAPTVRITSATAGDLFQIGNIAFDSAQNLWVTSFVGLLRFDDPGSQSGDVALAPGAVIEKGGYANNLYFYAVAFDAGGALWVASGDGLHYLTSVTEFKDPGSLKGRSSPTAAATITGDADLLPAGGLAFDGTGNLWRATGGSIVMYSDPRELSGIVNPAPAITLKVVGRAAPTTNSHLVFFPPPTGSVARRAPDAAAVD
jgi:ligand-binding sensor domain-containing protein